MLFLGEFLKLFVRLRNNFLNTRCGRVNNFQIVMFTVRISAQNIPISGMTIPNYGTYRKSSWKCLLGKQTTFGTGTVDTLFSEWQGISLSPVLWFERDCRRWSSKFQRSEWEYFTLKKSPARAMYICNLRYFLDNPLILADFARSETDPDPVFRANFFSFLSFYHIKIFKNTKPFVLCKTRDWELYNGTSPSFKLQIGFENGWIENQTLNLKVRVLWVKVLHRTISSPSLMFFSSNGSELSPISRSEVSFSSRPFSKPIWSLKLGLVPL